MRCTNLELEGYRKGQQIKSKLFKVKQAAKMLKEEEKKLNSAASSGSEWTTRVVSTTVVLTIYVFCLSLNMNA